eukprot:jgi/Botrbrau1/5181/Bobra.0172s0051.1
MVQPSGVPNPNKIKGGNWTVFLFAVVSVAYTLPWMTISSLLGYYSDLYGPQVLLLMNVAYFLLSIPLLILSSLLDEFLEAKVGVCRNLLGRMIFGLLGCALICSAFPFLPETSMWLLLSVTALGLLQAIAFSASYQLVARFANKNVVSLGLGCVASGLVAFLLELGLLLGPRPTRLQMIILFEAVAGITLMGLVAAVSLVTRHWNAIEGWVGGPATLDAPLLSAENADSLLVGRSSGLDTISSKVLRHVSGPLMLGIVNPLEYHMDSETEMLMGEVAEHYFADLTDEQIRAQLPCEGILPGRPPEGGVLVEEARSEQIRKRALEHQIRENDRTLSVPTGPITITELVDESPGVTPRRHLVSPFQTAGQNASPELNQAAPQDPHQAGRTSLAVLSAIWHAISALFMSGTFFTLVFPFFTYIQSTGLCGPLLPKVLFFVRLFCDVGGRMLPRYKPLATRSPYILLCLGSIMAASIPLFFLYLKAPEEYRSDIGIIVYIGGAWALGGYINTMCYTVAPQCVEGSQKAIANGLLALTYQVSHVFGLLLAIFLTYLIYGTIVPAHADAPPPPALPLISLTPLLLPVHNPSVLGVIGVVDMSWQGLGVALQGTVH